MGFIRRTNLRLEKIDLIAQTDELTLIKNKD